MSNESAAQLVHDHILLRRLRVYRDCADGDVMRRLTARQVDDLLAELTRDICAELLLSDQDETGLEPECLTKPGPAAGQPVTPGDDAKAEAASAGAAEATMDDHPMDQGALVAGDLRLNGRPKPPAPKPAPPKPASDDSEATSIRERLHQALEDGKSAALIGDHCNMGPHTIGRFSNGNRLKPENLEKVARGLEAMGY